MYASASAYLQILVSLSVLDPGFALSLRVDQQRETSGLGDDQAILDGQFVIGKTLHVPLRDCCVENQHLDDVQVLKQQLSNKSI